MSAFYSFCLSITHSVGLLSVCLSVTSFVCPLLLLSVLYSCLSLLYFFLLFVPCFFCLSFTLYVCPLLLPLVYILYSVCLSVHYSFCLSITPSVCPLHPLLLPSLIPVCPLLFLSVDYSVCLSITPVCPLFLMSVCPLLLSVPYSFCLSFTPVCPLLLLSVSNPQIQQSVDLCRTSESEFRLWCVGVSLLVRLTCVQPHRRYQHDLWCRIRILKKRVSTVCLLNY